MTKSIGRMPALKTSRNISASINLQDGCLYTNDSVLNFTVSIDVRKAKTYLGETVVTLSCEERAHTISNIFNLYSNTLTFIPRTLSRGLHKFTTQLTIPPEVSQYPSPILTPDPKVGVFWILKLSFTEAIEVSAVAVPLYPSRKLSNETWDAVLKGNHTDESSSESYNKSKDTESLLVHHNGLTSTSRQTSNSERDASGNEVNRTQIQRHKRYDGFNEVSRSSTVIISLKRDAQPIKQNNRILIALFGENFRHPEKGELAEIQVRSHLFVPEMGVFQSPHKANIRFQVWTAKGCSVILSLLMVKLFTETREIHTNHIYRTEKVLLEREPALILLAGTSDITNELTDLEIPTTCESTETEYLQRKYTVRIIVVYRAAQLSNMTRWHTVESPLYVLPSIQVSPGDDAAALPPPYHG